MSAKRKDTDYLCISAQIRSMERNLLDRARMERMLEAPTMDEAVRIVTELGYEAFDPASDAAMNRALLQRRVALFEDLCRRVPESTIIDVFKLKYDYHNLKVLIKSRGSDVSALLVNAGRVSAPVMERRRRDDGNWDFLDSAMAAAAKEAERVLAQTGDPLRSVIRTLRMGRSAGFLKEFLFAGGSVSVDAAMKAAVNGEVEQTYRSTPLRQAAQVGAEAVENGLGLTEFEKLCDDAVLRQAGKARRIPFGVEVVIGYVAACEAELTNLRIILTGRMAGLKADTIRERLRESYV